MALAAAGVVALGVAAAAVAFVNDAPPAPSTSLPAENFPEPGVEHAHGVGVDPGDGTLYAATHYGLLRIGQDGALTRVANRYQDTMGFEVIGPGRFLASGHPDFREDNPPLLGLIESRDGGQTWTPLSLRGEAGGRSWSPVSQAPQLAVVAWNAADELLGVAVDGAVHASADGGSTWSRRGDAGGEPEAMTLADVDGRPVLLVAVSAGRIVQSADGGRSFELRYSDE